MKTILLLDDDPRHLEYLSSVLEDNGFNVVSCQTVEEAELMIRQLAIDFAIVDLFLQGDCGDQLSNDFVQNSLVPAGIPFVRMSSAPGLVPKSHEGKWVYDKRKFHKDYNEFIQLLALTLSS